MPLLFLNYDIVSVCERMCVGHSEYITQIIGFGIC